GAAAHLAMKRPFSPPAHQPRLSREAQRAGGVYYTPPEIVRLIVDLTLPPRAKQPPRVIDPACGAGEFLVEAWRRIAERFGEPSANESIFGIDIDPQAIAHARQRLPDMAPEHLRIGDALTDDCFPPASFDVVIGNPPYVNIRQLAKSLPAERIAALKER